MPGLFPETPFFRALLPFLLCAVFSAVLGAQDAPDRNTLALRVELSGGVPDEDDGLHAASIRTYRVQVGERFTLSVFADHPVPGEVEAYAPELPEGARLEGTRILPFTGDDGHRFSRVDFDIAVLKADRLIIPPFEFSVPGKRGATAAFALEAGDGLPSESGPAVVLRWETPALPPRIGGAFVATLLAPARAASGGGELPAALKAAVRRIRILPPPNAIVEMTEPRVSGGGEKQPLLALRITVLSGNEFRLPAVDIPPAGGFDLQIPPLVLVVRPALRDAAPAPVPADMTPAGVDSGSDPSGGDGTALPWPEDAGQRRMSPAADRILAESRTLWESGRRAEALALVRQAERDRLSGFTMRRFRRSLETALGLPEQVFQDEFCLPKGFFLAGGIAAIFTFLILVIRGKRPAGAAGSGAVFQSGSGRSASPAWRLMAGAAAATLLLCVWGYGASGSGGRYALARATDLYRAPDRLSTILGGIDEGARVRVSAAAGDWAAAETAGGLAGWIPADSLVYY